MGDRKKDKTIYIIDYENVGKHGLSILGKAKKKDKVAIFTARKSDSISTEDLTTVLAEKQVRIFVVPAKKESADRHMIMYIGYAAGKQKGARIRVVSNDTGFDDVIEFLRTGKDADVQRCPVRTEKEKGPEKDPGHSAGEKRPAGRIKASAKQKPAEKEEPITDNAARISLNAKLSKALSKGGITTNENYGRIQKYVMKVIKEPGSGTKIRAFLTREFGQSTGDKLYAIVKKELDATQSL